MQLLEELCFRAADKVVGYVPFEFPVKMCFAEGKC